MPTTRLSRGLAAVAIASTALLGLTACTGFPGAAGSSTSAPGDSGPDGGSGDGQSVQEACQLVNDTITSATEEFEQATTEDPAAVTEAFTAAADSIAEASTRITNEEVAAILPSLQELFEQVAELVPAIIEGDTSKAAEFGEISEDLQSSMQEFEALCGASEE